MTFRGFVGIPGIVWLHFGLEKISPHARRRTSLGSRSLPWGLGLMGNSIPREPNTPQLRNMP